MKLTDIYGHAFNHTELSHYVYETHQILTYI